MREIKFRAWDNVDNKMLFVGEEEDFSFEFDSSGIVASDLREHDWDYKKAEHLLYMQYTGLKDKNGVEIYEGDILDYSGSQKDTLRFEVVFHHGSFKRRWVNNRTSKIRGLKVETLAWNTSTIFEVIGNIYENPELLEVSTE